MARRKEPKFKAIPGLIAKLRKQKGFATQDVFAQACRLSRHTEAVAERGGLSTQLTLKKIAAGLDCNWLNLLDLSADENCSLLNEVGLTLRDVQYEALHWEHTQPVDI